jgi:sporulation-control protein spo0M
MIVNKQLMAKARFNRKLIRDLTVLEFRDLMQQVLDAEKANAAKLEMREIEIQRKVYSQNPFVNPYPFRGTSL